MPTIAVIGASSDRSKFGNKCVRAYLQQRWEVYPVNPAGEPIEGQQTYPRVGLVPAPVDRVALYLPPDVGLAVLAELATVAHDEFFVNPGADSPQLLARARELGLTPVQTCAIVEVGVSPSAL